MTTQTLKHAANMVASGEHLIYAAGLYGVDVVALEVYMKVNPRGETYKANPQQHITNSGLCGHSIGDIYPYVIVITGSFTEGFKYHLTGNGLHLGDEVYDSYSHAHNEALEWAAYR